MKNKYYALIVIIAVLFILFLDLYIFNQTGIEGRVEGMAVNVTQQTGNVYLIVVGACSPELLQGWNLFSICANVSNKSVEHLLSSLGDDYRFVMEWNESSQDFLIYSPRAATNPFTEFNLSKSYFIYYKPTTGLLALSGSSYDDIDVFASYGWAVPFYPYVFTANVSGYLDDLGNDYRYMMKWNASLQEFKIYSPRAGINPFYTISEGEGQYLYVNKFPGVVVKYNKTRLQG